MNRESSYSHYTVLNLTNIVFPMTLKDIPKFEHLSDVSINGYDCVENKQALPLWLTGDKKEKHINMLYTEDSRDDSMSLCMD